MITSILIIMILLTLAEFGFVLSFKHPNAVATFLNISHKSPAPKIIFGISMILFVTFLYVFLKELSTPQPDPLLASRFLYQKKDPKIENTSDYKLIGNDTYATEENYYFLYTGSDKTVSTLENKANFIKNTTCKKPCIIHFYDDVLAFLKDRTRSTIISDQVMREWNQTNYVYVAEHFLGYLSPKAIQFTYYPYKDWYYNQLKSSQGNEKQ